MAFEKYVPTRAKPTVAKKAQATVTIRKDGELRFSQETIAKFGVDGYQYAELHYDKDTRRLGLVLGNTKAPGTLKFKKGSEGITIRIKGLLDKYGIRIRKVARKRIARDKNTGMLVVKLKMSGRRQETGASK